METGVDECIALLSPTETESTCPRRRHNHVSMPNLLASTSVRNEEDAEWTELAECGLLCPVNPLQRVIKVPR
jgi:hypothetical protein